jgi:hypothetical protein
MATDCKPENGPHVDGSLPRDCRQPATGKKGGEGNIGADQARANLDLVRRISLLLGKPRTLTKKGH